MDIVGNGMYVESYLGNNAKDKENELIISV
jgi:hypothetical protein